MKGEVSKQQRARLRALLQEGAHIPGSSLTLLNLETYQKALGADWPRYKTMVFNITRNVINNHIDTDDIVVEVATGFIVVFIESTDVDEEKVAAEIVKDVDEALAANIELQGLDLNCSAKSVNVDRVAETIMSGDISPLRSKAQQAAANAFGSDIVFRPIWSPHREIIFAAHCYTPAFDMGHGNYSDDGYYTESAETKDRDIYCIEKAVGAAYKHFVKGKATRIIFTLNFWNLRTQRYREEYIRAMRQAPSSILPLIIPRIARISFGTPSSTLAMPIHILKGIFPTISMETSCGEGADVLVLHDEFNPALCSVSSYMLCRARRRFTGAADCFKWYAAACHRAKRRCLINGLHDPAEVISAIYEGVDFMSGDGVCPPSDKFEFPEVWRKKDLPHLVSA